MDLIKELETLKKSLEVRPSKNKQRIEIINLFLPLYKELCEQNELLRKCIKHLTGHDFDGAKEIFDNMFK